MQILLHTPLFCSTLLQAWQQVVGLVHSGYLSTECVRNAILLRSVPVNLCSEAGIVVLPDIVAISRNIYQLQKMKSLE